MSYRTVFTAIFTVILTAAAANTGLAQGATVPGHDIPDERSSSLEVAPMPRERPATCPHCQGVLECCPTPAPVVVSRLHMTSPAVPAPPHCAFDCQDGIITVQCTGQSPQNLAYSGKLFFEPLPPLPSNPAERFGEYVEETRDGVRVVSFRVLGMPRTPGQVMYPMLRKSMIVSDDSTPGWWVESVRVPQPRIESTPNMLFLWETEAPQLQHEESHSCCTGTSATTVAACCTKSNKLTGMWVRELDDTQVVATIQNEEIKIRLSQLNSDGDIATVVLTADYTLTRDGLIHGAITGVDLDFKRGPNSHSPMDRTILSFMAQNLVDCPFSFRAKMTTAGLMVSGIKIGFPLSSEGSPNTELVFSLLSGMYTSVRDGQAPAFPKCQKAGVGSCEGNPGCMKSPAITTTGGYHQPVPTPIQKASETSQPQQTIIQPMVPPTLPNLPEPMVPPEQPGPVYRPMTGNGPEMGWAPKPPAQVPASAFDTIADALGQMVQELSTPQPAGPLYFAITPSNAPPPPAPTAASGVTVRLVCDRETSPGTAALPSNGFTGTWVREVGPMLYAIKFEPDQFTITASLAMELPDATVTSESLIITGDYHLMRDGKTLVGLITSVDMRLDSILSQEGQFEQIIQRLSQLQKDVTDQPFAFSARLSGNALTIGNVRFPDTNETDLWTTGIAIGGRYSPGCEKSLPRAKAMKTGVPMQNVPMYPPLAVCYPAVGIAPAGTVMGPPIMPQFLGGDPVNSDLHPPGTAVGPPIVPQTTIGPASVAPAAYPYCPQTVVPYATPQPSSVPAMEFPIPSRMPESRPSGPVEPPVSEKKPRKKQASVKSEAPGPTMPPTRIDVIR